MFRVTDVVPAGIVVVMAPTLPLGATIVPVVGVDAVTSPVYDGLATSPVVVPVCPPGLEVTENERSSMYRSGEDSESATVQVTW